MVIINLMNIIKIVSYNNWEKLYLNDKLFAEGHSITKWDYKDLIEFITDYEVITESGKEEDLEDQ